MQQCGQRQNLCARTERYCIMMNRIDLRGSRKISHVVPPAGPRCTGEVVHHAPGSFLPFGKCSLLLTVVLAALWMSGCKPATAVQATELRPRSADYIVRRVARHQVSAHWLSGRARIDFDGEGGHERISAVIRLQRDSALMLAFRKYNVEAARVLVRPDSIFVLDRLNKQYLADDIGLLRRRFGLPFGFQELQMLLLGNPVLPGTQYEARIDSVWYVIESDGRRYDGAWWFGPDWRLRKMRLYDPLRDEELICRLDAWQPDEGGTLFSYLRTLEVFTPATGAWQVTIHFSKVTLDEPKSLKFEIPEHYTKVE